MKKLNLLDCIGKAINTTEVQQLLKIVNINEKELLHSADSFTTYGSSESVELHFRKAEIIQVDLEDESEELQETLKGLIDQMLTEPKETLFLDAILTNNNSIFELGYQLPVLVEINKSTKMDIMNGFGEPYLVNERHNSIGWRINGYNFAGGFDKENDVLRDISIAIF